MSAGPAFTVFSKPAESLQQVVYFNIFCDSGHRNLSNFILMWREPQHPLVTAPSKITEGKKYISELPGQTLLYAFLLLLTALLFDSDS